jgi:hypothetical protein
MLIVTTIYYAEPEPKRDPATGMPVEKKPADLKDVSRKVVSVYQGTNKVLPGGNSQGL